MLLCYAGTESFPHDDVMKWNHFPRYWPFVRGNHRAKASDAGLWCFLRLNKRLIKQSWGWWFETLLCPLWRHCNAIFVHMTRFSTSMLNKLIWIVIMIYTSTCKNSINYVFAVNEGDFVKYTKPHVYNQYVTKSRKFVMRKWWLWVWS